MYYGWCALTAYNKPTTNVLLLYYRCLKHDPGRVTAVVVFTGGGDGINGGRSPSPSPRPPLPVFGAAAATGLRLYTPLHLHLVRAPRNRRRRSDTRRRRRALHTIGGRTLVSPSLFASVFFDFVSRCK